ncbi:MAG: spore germination protein [Clostridia bacterium]|nr:spore germination protein [Clostridia bacterium]
MAFLKGKAKRILRFDVGDGRFELTESERGAPRMLGGRRDKSRVKNRGDERRPIPKSTKKLRELLCAEFSTDRNPDLILRPFKVGGGRDALAVYMNGMADDGSINDFILRPLMRYAGGDMSLGALSEDAIEIAETKREDDLSKAMSAVLDGMTALFVDGEKRCLLLETRGYEKRAIGPAENEQVVIGPNESFTESLRTNITLIRRILRIKELIAEPLPSGGGNDTDLALIYRNGVTDERLVAEVKRRLDKADAFALTSSGMLEQLIEDSGVSPLPQMLSTERPDRAAAHVMRGRVCILLEGSPKALILPVTLFTLLDSPEDFYMRRPLGTVIRVVRYVGAAVSVLLPGYFLALALYHQGVLSTEVLSTVIASRRMVFEPIGVEMILLLLIFQMIREAGQRVPGSIGQAIGIIGGLIMGQAAVAANLASSVVLIIVAASGLGNFCIPDYQTQIAASYFRMALVISAWMGGLLGIVAALLLSLCLLSGMKSFGVPFLAPFAPKTERNKPLVIRGRLGGSPTDDELNTSFDARIRGTED